jgi:hypothetical protein
MKHFYESLTDTFLANVSGGAEPVIYWDQAVKFVGIRVEPNGQKTWMVHDWCGGSRDIGSYPQLKDRSAAAVAAMKVIMDQLEELAAIVERNGLQLSITRDALDSVKRMFGLNGE